MIGPEMRDDFPCHAPLLKLYHELPESVQRLAVKNYWLWRDNLRHPSLEFKKLAGHADRFSVRIGDHYRALGQKQGDGVEWVWIGTHEEYNKLASKR